MSALELIIENHYTGNERDIEVIFNERDTEYMDGYVFQNADIEIEKVLYKGLDITKRLYNDFNELIKDKIYEQLKEC